MERRQYIVRYARTALDSSLLEVVWEGFLPRALGAPGFRPPVDVFETDVAFLVTVEIAGVADDGYHVALHDNLLIISGERPWQGPPGDARTYLSEIRYGVFRVELELPLGLRLSAAEARYERGMLRIKLTKEGGAR